ncbi:MAG: 4Fe-4S binding protein, partial [Candidatus Hodarchaeales archaeon]
MISSFPRLSRFSSSECFGNDKAKATEKSIQLVKAGINRSRKLEPIETKKIPTTKAALVIGAGIAGLRAAYDMANLGIPVHVVERESSIGGHMVKLNKTFPTNECPQCSISPLTNGVADHPNITLHTLSTVKKVEGSIGNFEITIETKPRYVKDNCTSCGECSEVCPEEVPSKWNMGMSTRKAIYKLYPQAIPSTYVRDKKVCIECYACIYTCSVDAIDFDMEKTTTKITVGTIIVATGYQEYNPSEIEPYHYGEPGYEDVITQLQFERMMSPDSSTGGK